MDVSRRGWKIINHLASLLQLQSVYFLCNIMAGWWTWGLSEWLAKEIKKTKAIEHYLHFYSSRIVFFFPSISYQVILLYVWYSPTSSRAKSISCYFKNLKYTINRVYESWTEIRSVLLAWWQYYCAIQWCIDKLMTNWLQRSKIKISKNPVSWI